MYIYIYIYICMCVCVCVCVCVYVICTCIYTYVIKHIRRCSRVGSTSSRATSVPRYTHNAHTHMCVEEKQVTHTHDKN